MRVRPGIASGPRTTIVVLILAAASLLALAGGANAATFHPTNTEELVEDVKTANGNGVANTIVLASGGYTPTKALTLENTGGVQTIEGPASFPGATLNGGQLEPAEQEILKILKKVSVKLKKVTVTTAGGGVAAAIDVAKEGTLEVESSTVGGNTGAGIHVEVGAAGTVRNSTLSDGIDFGILNQGTTSLLNSTVAFNSNGGIDNNYATSTLNLTNTIVAENKGSGDCTAHVNTTDSSLDSDGSCGVTLSKVNPLLRPLANNGGPTLTRALQSGSPAIDAADSAACPATDQRGYKRPDIPSTACDIGAFESQLAAHFYKNNVKLHESTEGSEVMGWGTVTFQNPTLGTVTCESELGASILNPVGGGAGSGFVAGASLYDCVAEVCEMAKGKLEVIPENLPYKYPGWAIVIPESEIEKQFRLKVEGVTLTLSCKEAGKETNVKLEGTLRPKFLNGTVIGSGPARLEFETKFGSFQGGAGPVTFEGTLKFMGYEGGETIAVKAP